MPQGSNYLPVELWIHVFGYLRISDVLCARQTCKTLQEITCSHSLWLNIAKTHVIGQGLSLPRLPHPDLKSVDSARLEASVKMALEICVNIECKTPEERKITSRSIRPWTSLRVRNVNILPRKDGKQYVICSVDGPGIYVLEVKDEPFAVSHVFTWETAQRTSYLMVDKAQATVAYHPMGESEPISILNLCPAGEDVSAELVEIKKYYTKFDGPFCGLKKLKGSFLFFFNDVTQCEVAEWKTGKQSYYRLPPSFPGQVTPCVAMEALGNTLIVVTMTDIYCWEWKEDGHADPPFPFYTWRRSNLHIDAVCILPYNPTWRLSTRSVPHAVSFVLRANRRIGDDHFEQQDIDHYILQWDDDFMDVTFDRVQTFIITGRNEMFLPMSFSTSGRGLATGRSIDNTSRMVDEVWAFDMLRRFPKQDVLTTPIADNVFQTRKICDLDEVGYFSGVDYDDTEGRVVLGTRRDLPLDSSLRSPRTLMEQMNREAEGSESLDIDISFARH
ncbi:hypothetical protein FRB99_006692 [Tulasnella sp. 403]|nr:hypothetical protein FRB99_006692 [Tulasnella sp. 403]